MTPARPVPAAGGGPPQGILPLGRGSGLALGLVMLWMSMLVLLPLIAVLVTSISGGPAAFLDTISRPAVAASIRLTMFTRGGGDRRQHDAWAPSSPGCWSGTGSGADGC